jgi:hypothetical protein
MPGKECPNCGQILTRNEKIRLNNIVRLRQGVPCSNCGIRIRRTGTIYLVYTFALASVASGILHFAYPKWPVLLGCVLVGAAFVISSTLKIEIVPREAAPIRKT